ATCSPGGPAHHTVGIEQNREAVGRAVLLTERAIGAGDVPMRPEAGEHLEPGPVLLGPHSKGGHAVTGADHHRYPALLPRRCRPGEFLDLARAHRGEREGHEHHQHASATEISERDVPAVGGRGGELRGVLPQRHTTTASRLWPARARRAGHFLLPAPCRTGTLTARASARRHRFSARGPAWSTGTHSGSRPRRSCWCCGARPYEPPRPPREPPRGAPAQASGSAPRSARRRPAWSTYPEAGPSGPAHHRHRRATTPRRRRSRHRSLHRQAHCRWLPPG